MSAGPPGELAGYEIRVATPADRGAVLRLYQQLSPASLRMRFSSMVTAGDLEAAARFDERDDFLVVVAVAADRPEG